MENMTAKFAEAVLSRRKQLGLTQQEVADRVGTSKQMVSKYELGQRSPKVAMANAFAEALETTLDDLLGTDNVPVHYIQRTDPEPVPAGVPKTEESRIISGSIDRMPPEDRERALAILKAAYADYFDKPEDKMA